MNIFQIISEIEKVDPEVYDRLDSRRSIFKHMSGMGKKLSAAAIPLAFGAILNKAYAQTPAGAGVGDVLNFALSLEYLEMYFYKKGQGTAALQAGFSASNQTALNIITTDEVNHVKFLNAAITAAKLTPVSDPGAAAFDFTGGKGSNAGPFADVFVNPLTYLAVAQSLEDTGVRAYKGGAPLLLGSGDILTAALNIHSVEARHASRLRTMRRGGPMSNTASQGVAGSPNSAPKSWISGTDNGGASPTYTAAIYGKGNNTNAPTGVTFEAEDNVTQGGVNLQTALAALNFPASAFSEAFDEALDVTTVKTIARTFVVSGSSFLM